MSPTETVLDQSVTGLNLENTSSNEQGARVALVRG